MTGQIVFIRANLFINHVPLAATVGLSRVRTDPLSASHPRWLTARMDERPMAWHQTCIWLATWKDPWSKPAVGSLGAESGCWVWRGALASSDMEGVQTPRPQPTWNPGPCVNFKSLCSVGSSHLKSPNRPSPERPVFELSLNRGAVSVLPLFQLPPTYAGGLVDRTVGLRRPPCRWPTTPTKSMSSLSLALCCTSPPNSHALAMGPPNRSECSRASCADSEK
jgi:hypothetical protein